MRAPVGRTTQPCPLPAYPKLYKSGGAGSRQRAGRTVGSLPDVVDNIAAVIAAGYGGSSDIKTKLDIQRINKQNG